MRITGSIITIHKLDTDDWIVEFKRNNWIKRIQLWTTYEIGQRLDYLFRYGIDYAPDYTGDITIEVIPETGQIIDFAI